MAIFHIYTMIMFLFIFILFASILLYVIFPLPPKPKNEQYDTVIVLGYPSNKNGSISDIQKKRMDVAIHLYRTNITKTILVSGSSAHNEFLESETMANYALEQKVPKNDIILESKARNTYENLKYAKIICKNRNYNHVIVVTSPFHVRRASFFVKKFFSNYVMDTYQERITLKEHIDEYFRMWNTLFFEFKYRNKKD